MTSCGSPPLSKVLCLRVISGSDLRSLLKVRYACGVTSDDLRPGLNEKTHFKNFFLSMYVSPMFLQCFKVLTNVDRCFQDNKKMFLRSSKNIRNISHVSTLGNIRKGKEIGEKLEKHWGTIGETLGKHWDNIGEAK